LSLEIKNGSPTDTLRRPWLRRKRGIPEFIAIKVRALYARGEPDSWMIISVMAVIGTNTIANLFAESELLLDAVRHGVNLIHNIAFLAPQRGIAIMQSIFSTSYPKQ